MHKDFMTLIDSSLISHNLEKILFGVLQQYETVESGIEIVASLVLDLIKKPTTVVNVLQEMYDQYAPFRYSIENKETSLSLRNKKVVDLYTEFATKEEAEILNLTEHEAMLTKNWILKINRQVFFFYFGCGFANFFDVVIIAIYM